MTAHDPLARDRELAVGIAREAGKILMEGWGTRPAVDFKSEDINLVTEFDKRSEALVVERLAAAFPDDRVVAEEGTTAGTERAGQRVWYVDPLDGTTNFAHGMPIFSVALGLTVDRRPVLGVVEAPALGWSFAGTTTGGGSTFNGKPIAPSVIDRLARSLVVTGFPYQRNPIQNNLAEFAALTAAAQGTRRM
ncbi:MAG TPA: inositol monophosphatase family protein, partial [Polyangia bacterium]